MAGAGDIGPEGSGPLCQSILAMFYVRAWVGRWHGNRDLARPRRGHELAGHHDIGHHNATASEHSRYSILALFRPLRASRRPKQALDPGESRGVPARLILHWPAMAFRETP